MLEGGFNSSSCSVWNVFCQVMTVWNLHILSSFLQRALCTCIECNLFLYFVFLFIIICSEVLRRLDVFHGICKSLHIFVAIFLKIVEQIRKVGFFSNLKTCSDHIECCFHNLSVCSQSANRRIGVSMFLLQKLHNSESCLPIFFKNVSVVIALWISLNWKHTVFRMHNSELFYLSMASHHGHLTYWVLASS